MNIPSDVVQQITGTFIEDQAAPKSQLAAWIQTECRSGSFRQAIEKCTESQPEWLRPDLVLVEKIAQDKITLKVPGKMVDHESPSNFSLEVLFELNPLTLEMKRI